MIYMTTDIVMVVEMAAQVVEVVEMVFLSTRLCRRLEKPAMPGKYELSMNNMIVVMELIMTAMLVMMMMMMVMLVMTIVRPDWSVKHCCSQPA